MYFVQDTLDDLLHVVYRALLKSNNRVTPTKGPNREAAGVLLKLKNPRARFSRTEQRATLHSCLGETLWYFSGSDDLSFVDYYIPSYRNFSKIPSDATIAEGAYGPRLFLSGQVQRIVDTLNNADRRATRQAVIQIFDQRDIGKKDVPCTCTIQFLARGKKLHAFVSMRSNDAYRGLPHDIFAFTMLQEYVARSTDHELGIYNHAVGSLHLYDTDEASAKQYIALAWQEKLSMPVMPSGDPSSSMSWLLEMERRFREGKVSFSPPADVDPYWVDLARLLLIKRLYDEKNIRDMVVQKNLMNSDIYSAYIRGRELKILSSNVEQPILPGLDEVDGVVNGSK